jgi:hypothetical protein
MYVEKTENTCKLSQTVKRFNFYIFLKVVVMKRYSIAVLCTWIFLMLLCSLPSDPANDYGNSTVLCSVDSLPADSTARLIDTVGDTINFSFFRVYSQHIDSFIVNFQDGKPVRFATADYISDTIQNKHVFATTGHKVINLTIFYNNNTIRKIDTVAIFDIMNRKPVFVGVKADSVFSLNDSSSVTIPFKVKKWSSDSLIFSILSSTLPESSLVSLTGDSLLVVKAPKNTGGSFKVIVQVADKTENVSMTFNITIVDKTAPFAPVFTCAPLFATTTPTWTWKSGGNKGAGIYRFNIDNENVSASIFAEKAVTSFQPPMNLTEGMHTLYVQERDSSGNWSPISAWGITIDVTGPSAPVVSGTTPTNNRKPTWSWIGSNTVAPHFRVQLDKADFSPTDTSYTLLTSYTPTSDLSEGKHILYVREVDAVGNWSVSGSFTIVVDLTGPNPPTVTGTTPTSNNRPVWTWTTNGGGGTGEFRCALDTISFDSAFLTSAHMYTASRELGEGKHTLNVQELDSAGNWSTSGSFSIQVDFTAPNPPVVTVKSVTSSKTPTWTWTAGGGGNGTFRYKLDSDDLSSGATESKLLSYTPPTNLTEGLHTFYIQERDSTGNWSVLVAKATMIDLTPPEKPVISGTAVTNNTKPSWTWTTTGEGPFRVKIDSKDMSTGATALDTNAYTAATALTEGNHFLFVQASDSAGNWSPLDSFLTVIDLTPPAAPVMIGNPISNNPRPTWSWSSSGGNGQYRYKLDVVDLSTGAQTTTVTSFTPASDLAEGAHTLYVQESDAAGNWSTSGTLTTTIDLTAAGTPKVTGESPTNNPKPTWTWKSGGGTKSYRYKLDDTTLTTGATATTDSTFTPASAQAEGTHTLYVQEIDGASNWSPRGFFTIQIDLTPPSPPTLTGVTPTKNTKPTWNWKMGAGGNGTFRYKFNSSDLSSGATITTDTTLTPGSDLAEQAHTLYLQERDAAGNWSTTVSFAIVVDITAPNAPVVSGVTPTNILRPTWTWVSGGGGGNGKYRYSLDTAFSNIIEIGRPVRILWTTATQYQPTTDLKAGSHTLYVQEQDAAGNISASGSKVIVIDNTAGNAPVVTATTPTNNTTPTWSWTSGGGKGYYMYRLDDSYIEGSPTYSTTTSFKPSTALTEGLHILYVKEQDAAGNWSSAGYFGITIDITKPSLPVFTSGSTTIPAYVKSITWQWTAGSGSNGYCRYKLDNGSWSAEAIVTSYTASVGDGQHILYVKNRDAAGNWSDSTSKTIDVFPAPTDMKVTLDKATKIVTVTWTDNSTSELAYNLYLTTYSTYNPSGPFVNSFQAGANGTAIQLGASTELCTVIYYHLIAVKAGFSTPALTVGTGCINYP